MVKSAVYARAGVPEYWIVDPPNRSIEVFSLDGPGYTLASSATGSGTVLSRVLPGLSVDVNEVMPESGKV